MKPSIVHVLFETAERYGERDALRSKVDGRWEAISWNAYAERVRLAARGLISLGLNAGDRASLVGFNCANWLVGDMGIMAAGGTPAPLYANCTAEQAQFILDHCEAKIVIGDTMEQINKIKSGNPRTVTQYILMNGVPEGDVMSFDELLSLGEGVEESVLDARLDALEPAGLATLIYTSGTTGPPKGVMLTHENLVFTAASAVQMMGFREGEEQLISYLPLSHIAEQIMSVLGPPSVGATVSFAESLEALAENLREVRPTVFFAVPRVWEKMQAKIVAAGKETKGLKRKIAGWAKGVGLEAGRRGEKGLAKPFGYGIAEALVFSKVRERLGFDRLRMGFTAAAPIARSTLDFFFSLGVPIYEVYGMSENTGPATMSNPRFYKIGKCGLVLTGTELKIAQDGEICMRGQHVFNGYLHDPEKSAEALDSDGWLHSGDIGVVDEDGFLQITDRKKDLIITAGGKNIAPQNLEARFKSIDGIAQVCVIGDRRKYVTALLTVDREEAPAVARELGIDVDVELLYANEAFQAHVRREVERINADLARFETVKYHTLLKEDFTVEGGELTPTMKMKRKVVQAHFSEVIEAMYPDQTEAAG